MRGSPYTQRLIPTYVSLSGLHRRWWFSWWVYVDDEVEGNGYEVEKDDERVEDDVVKRGD